MGKPEILLVRVGMASPSVLQGLAVTLARALGVSCDASMRLLDPEPAYDSRRGQYNATQLLHALEARFGGSLKPGQRVLGVTDHDLCIPILTFVFGEAFLERPFAILSTHRLYPQFYGLPKNPELLNRRTVVEAAHEVGHTYQLKHCADTQCLMHASRVADEIDLKGPGFCPECAGKLARHGLNPLLNL